MSRPAGRRNTDFDQKRRQLARLGSEVLLRLGPGASLRDISEAMEVSVTNLKHYFVDRDGLLSAILEELGEAGQGYLDEAATPQGKTAETALRAYLMNLMEGWRVFGVDRVFLVGLSEGLGHEGRGQAYVHTILEPTLQSCERLLIALIEKGWLPTMEVRGAALSLVGPIILGLIHQDGLFGSRCRPLDMLPFLENHLQGWLKGYSHQENAIQL